jgi:O-antigen/teichoic acid export membrane protein
MPNNPSATTIDHRKNVDELFSDEEIRSIKSRTVTGAFSYFFKTLLLQGLGLVTIFLLSAFFEPEDFGVYGYVVQIIGLLIFFSDIGLAAALVQKKQKPTLTDYRTAFTVQQMLSWLIVIIVLIIIATGVVQRTVGQQGVWILMTLAISFPLASLKTISSIQLERELKFSLLIVPQIFEQITFDGILVYFAWQGMGAGAYTWAILARSILGTIVMLIIRPWKIGFTINKKSLKSMLGFGAKFQLNDFLARIKDQLYFLVLGQVLPLNQFGFIQWAKNWSMYPYNLTVQNVMAITFPTFSKLQKRKDLLKKALEKSIFFISLLIFPILTGMCLMIMPLTQVVEQYEKWQPAVASFIFFALSIGWAAISTPLVNSLNAIGQINKTLKLMIIWTTLTWTITPLTLLFFGFNGVGLAALIVSFSSFLSIKFVRKYIDVDIWQQVWRQLVSVAGMAIVGIFLQTLASQSISRFIFSGLVIGLSYLTILMIIGHDKLIKEVKSLRS